MGEIKDAVIVAAGLGTRMLPASAAIGKEVLPLVDVPGIFHLIWESVKAGCKRIHLVISPEKTNFVNILNPSQELIDILEKQVTNFSKNMICPIPDDIELFTHFQKEPRGLMDAISCATNSINNAFLVLLGDNLLINDHKIPKDMHSDNGSNASLELISTYNKNSRPVVGIKSVQESSLSKYGVVKLDGEKIIGIVEKPSVKDAPSDFVLCGRYIFTPEMIDLMHTYTFEEYGELQSIVIQKHCMKEEGGLLSVKLNQYQWYDSGNPLSWIKSQVDHALRRNDIGSDLNEWLAKRLVDENHEIN